MNICDLDDYSLGHVLLLLDAEDLERCSLVCKRFQHMVHDVVYPQKCRTALVVCSVNSMSCSPYRYTIGKRVRLHDNWRDGRYAERQFFHHRQMYISCIMLDRKWLYMTHGGQIRVHRRTTDRYLLNDRASWTLDSTRKPDITWLTRGHERIYAGRVDGACVIYNTAKRQLVVQGVADDVITTMDCESDLCVVSTKSEATYVLSGAAADIEISAEPLHLTKKLDIPYQTVKLNGSLLAAGQFHSPSKEALQLLDLESWTMLTLDSPTHAVYQLLWKDEHCILTGNFDSSLRLVDTRTGQDEAEWQDPYDASVYCMCYDGSYAVHCGLKYHFRANLYDLRVPRRCVQMYFPLRRQTPYSPVYGIAADVSQLFLVTDHNLRVLDFNANYAAKKDYANLL